MLEREQSRPDFLEYENSLIFWNRSHFLICSQTPLDQGGPIIFVDQFSTPETCVPLAISAIGRVSVPNTSGTAEVTK